MDHQTLITRAEDLATRAQIRDGMVETGVAGLGISRRPTRTQMESMLYDPLVCLVLQGAKETGTHSHAVHVGAGQLLIVSHDIPIVSRVIDADPAKPYIALVLPLDLDMLRGLATETGDQPVDTAPDALQTQPATPEIADAFMRLLALANDPAEARVLAPLILKEIHYRLLRARGGGVLRALLWQGSHASRIARAIAHIRAHADESLPTQHLAGIAGMSASTFHAHFKAVTSTTPLQFQKDLRLLNARDRLQGGADSVSTVAFDVGYESPTQFSRDYSRKFGAPPRADLKKAS
ncbi:AraC family transcriptional regulator [Pseudoruegeria sp. HB172150]|uniref:AraC family transcriptional regulator n=1 Tax=Pseudoruegeria sp. HB172150 TaxID=2721164 RepID=UPI0015580D93|nr:AraC family transcriptional regulator [Pseudoruegeria sp. HB172150]